MLYTNFVHDKQGNAVVRCESGLGDWPGPSEETSIVRALGTPTSGCTTPRSRSRIVVPDRESVLRSTHPRRSRSGPARSHKTCDRFVAIGFACRPHSALLSSSCFAIGTPSPVPTRNGGFLFSWKNLYRSPSGGGLSFNPLRFTEDLAPCGITVRWVSS